MPQLSCLACKAEFVPPPNGRLVCDSCSDLTLTTRRGTLAQRLWGRTYQVGQCWEWSMIREGGQHQPVMMDRRQVPPAHAALWLDGRKRPNAGYEARRTCGRSACIRPAHLEWAYVARRDERITGNPSLQLRRHEEREKKRREYMRTYMKGRRDRQREEKKYGRTFELERAALVAAQELAADARARDAARLVTAPAAPRAAAVELTPEKIALIEALPDIGPGPDRDPALVAECLRIRNKWGISLADMLAYGRLTAPIDAPAPVAATPRLRLEFEDPAPDTAPEVETAANGQAGGAVHGPTVVPAAVLEVEEIAAGGSGLASMLGGARVAPVE